MNKNSVLFKKIYGCMMGGVIGDAFGGPVEGMDAGFIRKLHNGPVTNLISYATRPEDFFMPAAPSAYAWSDRPGTYTDDSYFATVNARCIIEHGGRITCDELGDFWVKNVDVDRCWYSSASSYWRLVMTYMPARQAGAGNIGENSSAMCIGPVGIINACDPKQASLDAYDLMSIIHHDHSRDAAGIIAAAVAEAMNPQADVDSIVQAALDNIPGGRCSKMYGPMHLAVKLAREAEDTEELTKLYYDQLLIDWCGRGKPISEDGRHNDSCEAYESIPCAVGMFLNTQGDYKKTVIGAANFGRDCDTIACMAGYIAGAFRGIEEIPEKWISTCLEANPDPDLEKLAEGMTEALLNQTKKVEERCGVIMGMEQ